MLERIPEKDRHPCNCGTCNLKKPIKINSYVFDGMENLNLGHKCIITGLYCEGNYEYLNAIDKVGCAAHPLWMGGKDKETLAGIKKFCESEMRWSEIERRTISKQVKEGTFPEELNPDIHHGYAQGTAITAANVLRMIKDGEK